MNGAGDDLERLSIKLEMIAVGAQNMSACGSGGLREQRRNDGA
jgi:hypothetical protein